MFKISHAIILAGLLLSPFVSAATAGALSPDEKQKQEEFHKAYISGKEKGDRVKAFHILDGLAHKTTIAMIYSLAMSDPDKDVRLEACQVLSKAPVRDQTASQDLANIFNALKPNDFDNRFAVAQTMTNSAFKYYLVLALVDFGSKKLQYPDLQVVIGGVDRNGPIRTERTNFEKFILIFNGLSGANLTASSRLSPTEVKKWWDQNSAKISQADQELLNKYKAEDKAAEGKDKPN